MGKRKPPRLDIRSPLERFESGRPWAWSKTNLLIRAKHLADYTRKLITIRGQEIGNSRDRDLKHLALIEKLQEQLEKSEARVGRLQEVASAAAWVIADHMSGSYNAIVFNDGRNELINSEQHGDGICRVLASRLAKLELPDDMEGVEDFVTDNFERTHGLLVRSAPRETAR